MCTHLLLFSLVVVVSAWPDGAPCIHSARESMNPLEAVEHQGGLQLTAPPYEIKVDQKCYWRNQPIALTLQGLNNTVWFKGFVIQPFEWSNGRIGKRIGQIVRLDDNGSWQQQCFRFKDSATHSHDEKKKHMRMWWKVDGESDTVQFVATVVKHQTMFWVRSVVSNPIPPCRLNRFGIKDYVPPVPSQPPPVKQFKMETHQMFGNKARITPRVASFRAATTPMPAPRQTPRPNSVPQQMTRIIPITSMETVHSHNFAPTRAQTPTRTQTRPPVTQQPRARIVATNRRLQNRVRPQPRPAFTRAPVQQRPRTCSNLDTPARCTAWRQFCRVRRFYPYMSVNCRATCGFC